MHHSITPKMNGNGKDWSIPPTSTSPVDVLLLQPDFEARNGAFPVHSSKTKQHSSIFSQSRRVHFARPLAVEALIPNDYSQPLQPVARVTPRRLTIRELQERVESLIFEARKDRKSIHNKQQILYYAQQKHETEMHTRDHATQMKRNAIRELHQECERLEQSILKIKSEIQEFKQQSVT